MSKSSRAESTLTDRYQTTIPEAVREALHLHKRDKIHYTVQEDGKVLLSRANQEDQALDSFLHFLATEIQKNPEQLSAVNPELVKRARALISKLEIDLDAPLSDKDE